VATLDEIARRGADATYFLGDLGAFGPYPDRVPELLIERGIAGIQGNYEESLASGATDCNCGYTDPRDNEYAQISYDYTASKTSDAYKRWMGTLPKQLRLDVDGYRLLLCHGSPRRINEFLWRSTSPDPFLHRLCDEHDADVIVCTHTGLHWHRALGGKRHLVNAGVIGRPANDGRTNVWFTLVTIGAPHRGEGSSPPGPSPRVRREGGAQRRMRGALAVDFIPIEYDHAALAREMRAERLPQEFIETVETGWWTTCLEALPAKERMAGRF